jgi:DNA topoisomerase-1
MIRFNRKTREHYLTSTKDAEPTGWTAHFAEGKWVPHREERPEPASKGKTTKRRAKK